MKPSVQSLAAPSHSATHPPTQPDEPVVRPVRVPRPVGSLPEGFSAGHERARENPFMKVLGVRWAQYMARTFLDAFVGARFVVSRDQTIETRNEKHTTKRIRRDFARVDAR